jgi:hypothetical protein
VTHPFSGAINAVRSIFGIHSPSRVFRDIASYTADGFVNGLAARADDIASAYDVFAAPDVAGVPLPKASGGIAGSLSAVAAASSAGGAVYLDSREVGEWVGQIAEGRTQVALHQQAQVASNGHS